jgi:RNA polymerase sigma-70 factor (ECF subfamily)
MEIEIEEIVSGYHQKIYKLCLFYLNNDKQEAEELAQEIFIKIMKKLRSFKGEANIYTWIYRISVNTLLNYIKRKKIVEFISFENVKNIREDPGDLSRTAMDPAEKLEEDESKKNKIEILNKCIALLSSREKTAFYLFYYDSLKQKEIAEIMKTSISAVESLIHKAKNKIKKWIAQDKC